MTTPICGKARLLGDDINTDLAAETWYEVRLDTGAPTSRVKALDGSIYKGSDFLGAIVGGPIQLDDFRWHFRTRAPAQAKFETSNVLLSPAAMTAP